MGAAGAADLPPENAKSPRSVGALDWICARSYVVVIRNCIFSTRQEYGNPNQAQIGEKSSMTAVRSMPCTFCPYRRDCPSGIWALKEYELLRLYDAETVGQPPNGFGCHATPDHYCNGWAIVHSSRGHAFDLLALRIHWPDRGIPEPAVPLFGSGAEAADHGEAAIESPPEEAFLAVDRLLRKYPRIG